MQQNACHTSENIVSIQAVNRTKVQGKATMNNEESSQFVGSNPTAKTISPSGEGDSGAGLERSHARGSRRGVYGKRRHREAQRVGGSRRGIHSSRRAAHKVRQWPAGAIVIGIHSHPGATSAPLRKGTSRS